MGQDRFFFRMFLLPGAMVLATVAIGCHHNSGEPGQRIELVNVSYDPTRELYQDFNLAFAKYWASQKGQQVTVRMSHGGSGKQ